MWSIITYLIVALFAFFVSHNLDWEFLLFILVAAFVGDLIARLWRAPEAAGKWKFVIVIVLVIVFAEIVALVPHWASFGLLAFFIGSETGEILLLQTLKEVEDEFYNNYKWDKRDNEKSAAAAEERAAEAEEQARKERKGR